MSDMMTLEQAELELANLTANYRRKGKVLRTFIAVLKADEPVDAEEGGDEE